MAHASKTASPTLETIAQMPQKASTMPKIHPINTWAGMERVHDPYVQHETDDPHNSHWRDNDRGHAPDFV
jgi:hypothetical protein